jgi:glycosyltransferase involved in cell wall biosynthesis
MPGEAPLVAICMATFEPDPRLLERQIGSIREQTHESWVCLVSDDGSSAERLGHLRELTGGDERFTISVGEERLGFYANFERALGMVPAEAQFVALADQDDRWYPEKLAALLAGLGAAQLVYSDMRIVDEDGAVVSETFWRGRRNNYTDLASLLLANTVTGAASLFRRELLDFVLPFPEPVGDPFHDQWIAAMALAVGEIAYIERPLYDYVQHGAAARGHEAAMRPWDAGRLLDRDDPKGSWSRLRSHADRSYETNARRIALSAREIAARAGGRMAPSKARAVRRLASLDRSLGAGPWLAGRSLRRLAGRNETMGIELSLLAALLLHRR